jgi:hypothetical protein
MVLVGGPPPGLIPPTQIPPPPPMPTGFTTNGLAGEWHRTAGPVSVGLTVGPQRLTIRAAGKKNDDPRTVVLTAEYRELRDGMLVGVVTSCDVEGGDVPDTQDLRDFVDQPVSCRYRLHDDELVVIDVKVGGLKLDADELWVAAGRYKKGKSAPQAPAKGKKEMKTGALSGGAIGAATGSSKTGAVVGGLVGAAVGGTPAERPAPRMEEKYQGDPNAGRTPILPPTVEPAVPPMAPAVPLPETTRAPLPGGPRANPRY